MNAPPALVNLTSRFNAMTLRERALVAGALLALFVLLWDQLLMNPLRMKRTHLTQEIGEVQAALKSINDTIEGRATDDPLSQAMEQKRALTHSLAQVDAELQSTSAGLIAPQRMVDALQDVLRDQQGLRLISVRNFPVTPLMLPAAAASTAASRNTQPTTAQAKQSTPAAESGPYVHSMELVIEGNYMDILKYLQRVEALPWRFYWQVLELKAGDYPLNRVRIRVNTLSMDKEWLGV